jgi:proteasome lid subunit RPN8/RPN11
VFKEIELETRKCFPNEMCGYIDKDDNFKALKNVAEKPLTTFEPEIEFFLQKFKGNVKALVHSHTTNKYMHICTPSREDVELQKEWGIPFLISGFDGKTYHSPITIPSVPNDIFINRPYIFGVSDCGMLIRDYYHYMYNIPIKLTPSDTLVEKALWSSSIRRLLELNEFEKQTGTPKTGDLLVVSIMGGFANHVVILTEPNVVLNQREFSRYEPLKLHEVESIWRHKCLL